MSGSEAKPKNGAAEEEEDGTAGNEICPPPNESQAIAAVDDAANSSAGADVGPRTEAAVDANESMQRTTQRWSARPPTQQRLMQTAERPTEEENG
jgi:hypothetical protein